jgi:hypothetical protein
MNCKICGAPIAEGQEFCEDCRARHTSAAPAEIVPETGKAHGRAAKVSGIVALVLSILSEIAWGIGYGLIIVAFAAIETKDNPTPIPKAVGDSLILGGKIATVITAVICVVGLVFGIRAIAAFRRAKKEGVKPVGGLVMGIIGLAGSAGMLLSCILNAAMAVLYTVAPNL